MGQAKAVRSSATAVDSVVALLRDLIDYAGLFPPASLAMPVAVANYEKYLQSEFSWMLGRFIVPAARLGEFREAVGSVRSSGLGKGRSWDLSALLGADVRADFDRVSEFNSQKPSHRSAIEVKIESVEVKATSGAEVERISKIICPDLKTYFEIPWGSGDNENVHECVKAASACGRRAKIRTGGETADKFPPAETVIEFIEACGTASVAFKATAGLHHPVRARHRLTYQPESPSGLMHGFLNVFLAAAFVRSGMDSPLAVELLKEQTPDAFEFDAAGVAWRGHRVSTDRIVETRRNFSISFGSCSFTEPIDDLRWLHLL
jgi:hypothetical protein